MRMPILLTVFGLISLLFLLQSCGEQKSAQTAAGVEDTLPPPPACRSLPPNTLITDTLGFAFDLRTPAGSHSPKNLLILPGWNFPKEDWCLKSALCDSALARGYTLILPEMGKSIYHDSVYAETRADWRHEPTGTWLWDTLIPYLQDTFCLLKPGQPNFVMGLSTGARGAVVLTYQKPGLFSGCAALSGDYIGQMLENDNLLRGYLGQIGPNKERFKRILINNNPNQRAKSIKTPLYLGHGLSDKVVDPYHSQAFFLTLQTENHALHPHNVLHLDSTAGHDYHYWNSEVGPALDFFAKQF